MRAVISLVECLLLKLLTSKRSRNSFKAAALPVRYWGVVAAIVLGQSLEELLEDMRREYG